MEVYENHNGQLNQETISDMEYLDAVFSEDLRIAPPATLHVRTCTKDCEVFISISYIYNLIITSS